MNKVALVTGSTSKIGSSIIKKLAENNYDVIIHYNTNEDGSNALENIVKNYNVRYMKVKCDLENYAEIENMCNTIYEKFDHIDVLVNNAAVEISNEFINKNTTDFEKTLKVNLIAPSLLSRIIGEKMYQNKFGKIINITSNNALNEYDSSTLEYDCSKSGLITLTHDLAIEYSPYVNVNAIAPGWIMTDKVKLTNDNLDGMLEKEESKKILKKRFGKPEEVASLVLFLCSENAEYINNEVIRIDGGVRW